MNARTRLSAKGQLVIPKAVRERMGLSVGDAFDVIEDKGMIILRPKTKSGEGRSLEQTRAALRKLYVHKGLPMPIERLSWSPDLDDSVQGSH